MTRKIYIGDTGGSVEDCKDRLQRKSEERLIFEIVSLDNLKKKDLTKNATKQTMHFYIPFLNNYRGLALYVPSNYIPKGDVDIFFSKKVHNDLGSILYFLQHGIWLFDCASDDAKNLNTFYVDTIDPYKIRDYVNISIIDNI